MVDGLNLPCTFVQCPTRQWHNCLSWNTIKSMEKPPTTLINTEKETRSFFWFMTLILACLSVWVIIELPRLHKLSNMIFFILCMGIHIALHWLLRKFVAKPGWTIGYILIQGSLTALMILISQHIGVTIGLTMALIGEAIGVYGLTKKGFLSALFYTLLSFGFYVWIVGFDQLIWWLVATIPMMIFVVLYVELYSRQANANEKAQELLEQLESTNQQLTDYAAQVEDLTIATERQRMARELHDTLSQGLAGLILQLEAVDANLANGKSDRGRQIVQQAMESARQTLFEARMAIDDLRQEKFSDCCGDLDKKIKQFTKNTGIPCEFQCQLPENLTPEISEALVGVVTESLMNVTRHANAATVKINVEIAEGFLNLNIQDNGQGFDPSAVPAGGHYGLIGMRERVNLVNGSFAVISQPGAGTTINVRIPCS